MTTIRLPQLRSTLQGYKWVNGIGAINYDGNRWTLGGQGSNRGRHVHLVAPGDSLIQPDPTGSAGQPGNYLIFDGATSLATAMASGVAGLMIAEDPELTPHIIEVLLRKTAEDDLPGSSSTPNTDTGFGLIDAGTAVTLVTKGVMWGR